jgi:4-hydroxybenzoate polyprenyltransferase
LFATAPLLAYGINNYHSQIVITIICTIIALYSGFFTTLLWNDLTDVGIDKIAHPSRPLPAGRISSKKMFMVALIFSVLTFLFSLFVSIWCFFLVGIAALFVTIHNKYLKKRITFPAYSEIFTPIQWIVVPLFGYLAIWTSLPPQGEYIILFPLFGYISFDYHDIINLFILVLFTYFADSAHDLPEGIHDIDGDRKSGVSTYATSFGEKTTGRISFLMIIISGLLGLILYIRTILTWIFLVPFFVLWCYALFHSFSLLRANKQEMRKMGKIVGQKTFRFFWVSYDLMFLDVFIQLVLR